MTFAYLITFYFRGRTHAAFAAAAAHRLIGDALNFKPDTYVYVCARRYIEIEPNGPEEVPRWLPIDRSGPWLCGVDFTRTRRVLSQMQMGAYDATRGDQRP